MLRHDAHRLCRAAGGAGVRIVPSRDFPGSGRRIAIYTNAPTAAFAAAELMFLLWKAREKEPECHVSTYGDIDPNLRLAEWASQYRPADWAIVKGWAGLR